MIKIYVQNGKAFVWNAEDVFKLRKDYRIVGKLVGCFPKQAFQNAYKYLPLQLMPEEALLLKEKGICQFLSNAAVEDTPSPENVTKYWQHRNNCCDEQIAKFKQVRLKTILEKVDEILEGKRKRNVQGFAHKRVSKRLKKRMLKSKAPAQNDDNDDSSSTRTCDVQMSLEESSNAGCLNDSSANSAAKDSVEEGCSSALSNDILANNSKELDKRTFSDNSSVLDEAMCKELEKLDPERRAIVEEELLRTPKVSQDSCMVQLFTECIWKKDAAAELPVPSTNEQLRYAVFKDLWEKNYYITPGMKFGGDFLVYTGDPVKFHALFIVLCIDRKQNFCTSQLITYGRLGNQVKKSFVLASLMPNGTIEYISLKWAAHLVSDKYDASH